MADNGRPTKYKPEYDEQAYDLIRNNGTTHKVLAKVFGVTESTLYLWKSKIPSFSEACNKALDEFLADTALKSLRTRLKGKAYKETTEELDNDGKLRVTRKVTKQIQPSDTAIIFTLKNKAGWRDRQEIDHSGSVTVQVVSYADVEGQDKDQD